ncbi:MAG: monovalent cation/H(+) antiporter subunit G [Actinomycetota bacterium]|nr:monovalent cation/H(+) antiporter subunit G [Actinomycetota bacterium]
MAVTLAYESSVLSTGTQVVAPFLADALVVLGVLVMTVGVYGVVRLPDAYTRLHAAGKAVFLGLLPLLLASALAGNPDVVPRVLLIAFFLLVTTPVSAHVIGRAAYLRRERMCTPEAINESDRDLRNPDT